MYVTAEYYSNEWMLLKAILWFENNFHVSEMTDPNFLGFGLESEVQINEFDPRAEYLLRSQVFLIKLKLRQKEIAMLLASH